MAIKKILAEVLKVEVSENLAADPTQLLGISKSEADKASIETAVRKRMAMLNQAKTRFDHGDLQAVAALISRAADTLLKDPSLKDPSLKDPSLKDPSLKDPSLKDPSLKDPSLKDPSLKDPSLKDPGIGQIPIDAPPPSSSGKQSPDTHSSPTRLTAKPIAKPLIAKTLPEQPAKNQPNTSYKRDAVDSGLKIASSKSTFSRRHKRASSWGPLILISLALCVGAAGIGYYYSPTTTSSSQTALSLKNGDPTVTADNSKPAEENLAPSASNTLLTELNNLDAVEPNAASSTSPNLDSDQQPTPDIDTTAIKDSNDHLPASDPKQDPTQGNPSHSFPPSMDDQDPNAPNPSPTENPSDDPSVTPTQLSPELQVLALRHLDLAIEYLVANDQVNFELELKKANLIGSSSENLKPAFDVTNLLAKTIRETRATIVERLDLLNTIGDFQFNDTYISVIQAKPDGIVLRTAGQRKQYSKDDLPISIAIGMLGSTTSTIGFDDAARNAIVRAMYTRKRLPTPKLTLEFLQIAKETAGEKQDYSQADLDAISDYVQATGNLDCMIGPTKQINLPDLADSFTKHWAIYSARVKSDKQWTKWTRASLEQRPEIRLEIWNDLNETEPSLVASKLILELQIAATSGDFSATLQWIRTLDRWLPLADSKILWDQLSRWLVQSTPNENTLVSWLTALQAQRQATVLTEECRDGIRQLGRQLATKISTAQTRRSWLAEFSK